MPLRYSTGCVASYIANCGAGPDLPLTIPEGANVRAFFNQAGFQQFTSWNDGDVWGSDFRDGTDLAGDGGSDVPEIYFFSGHGSCQNPPGPTSPDFIIVCGNFGKPDATTIGTQSQWGNGLGNLKFAFIDASCPMDLVSIENSWFPVFQGLHIAVGHSGDLNHDTLDSADRGGQFAGYAVGGTTIDVTNIIPEFFAFPKLSVGNAWMQTGLIDVQGGVSAVILAAGDDRNDAIDRRENEQVTDNRPDPTPNWFAWKWVTA